MTTQAAPTNLTIIPGIESLAVSWQTSITEGLGGWLLHVRPKGAAAWSTVALAATVRSYVITGLRAETYEIEVRALVAGGLASTAAVPFPKEHIPSTPVLSVQGDTVSWEPVPGATAYEFATVLNPTTTRDTTYLRLTARSITPPAVPGQTVNYGCKVASPTASGWAKEVSITYPKAEEPPHKEEPPIGPGEFIVGADVGGWGGIFAQMAAEGIKHFRTGTTAHIAEAAQHGITPATVIFGEGGTIGSLNPTSYAASVKAAVEQYKLPAIEVLNEPGGSWFWTDPTNYSAYSALLKATHEALAGTGCKVLASWDDVFGPGAKRAGGYAFADGVTVHPYGGSSGQHGGAQGNRAMIEAAHRETGLPVYITEVGWPTATGRPSTGDSQQWSEAQQAANIKSLGEWCEQQRYVAMLIIYNLINAQDTGSAQYGVWKHTLAPKLGASALAELARKAA